MQKLTREQADWLISEISDKMSFLSVTQNNLEKIINQCVEKEPLSLQMTNEGRYLFLTEFHFPEYPHLACELKLHAPGIVALSKYLTIRLTKGNLTELRNNCNRMLEHLDAKID